MPECIKDTIQWIDDNSTLAEMLFKILCGALALLGGWLLFYFKFYRKQKSAALFGFYIQFDLLLSTLKKQIDSTSDDSNPFIIMYQDTTKNLLSVSLSGGDEAKAKEPFLPVCQELKKLFLSAEHNVYPKPCWKKSWYQGQKTVLDFVLLITDKLGENTIGLQGSSIERDANNSITGPAEALTHITKWNDLKTAVDNLLEALEEVKY